MLWGRFMPRTAQIAICSIKFVTAWIFRNSCCRSALQRPLAGGDTKAGRGQGQRAGGYSVAAHEIAGLVEVNPEGGKVSRAAAASPQLESGNWYLPHPLLAPLGGGVHRRVHGIPHRRI